MDDEFLREVDGALTGWDDPVSRLKDALGNDELALFCQPIRTVLGPPGFPMAEILVRLREEESALLPPGEFLPVFEHYRLMPQLDRWVTRAAIRRLGRGSKIPALSINVSGQTLEDDAFAPEVAVELQAAGLAPRSILFEINEPDVLGKPVAAATFAASVKRAGGGVMIDGFGRRAASFEPLKTLHPDFVKVDGSVVRRLLSSDAASNKVKAIVRVGEVLGFGVIAECVEEENILLRLKALGVGFAQGFGIYRPHPADSILG